MLGLQDVREVGLEAKLELEQPLFRRVVGDDDVFVRALRHEAVSLDGERRVLALGCRDHPPGEVVDRPARERLQRLTADQQLPLGKVPNVVEEEPFGPVGLHVAVLLREEEGAAVQEQQV